LQYLKPYKWLVILILFLAAINMGFSLLDPILLGKLVNLAADQVNNPISENQFYWGFSETLRNGKPYWQLG
ncbi:MAG TPA: hypothetical protein PKA85_03575, partial [Ferruginibacter sp.]|nr:hypothetical protein [Ferruginibacter sp.]